MEEQKISLVEVAYLQTIEDLTQENKQLRNNLNYTRLVNQELSKQIEELTAPVKEEEKEDVQEEL
ncbi:hypothetical protein KBI51_08935 [Aerococcaceae bacterium zg-ZUI334]|uniref:hypothetical protein n=1 Tax=Aerococcaceae bacterium zg-252 TaxID=2796928 RepID=UPI001B8F0D95|nr:hypothetical protein [Aerococcaceae bacterium zg-ZUI334]